MILNFWQLSIPGSVTSFTHAYLLSAVPVRALVSHQESVRCY